MLVTLTAGNTRQTREQTENTLTLAFDIIRRAVARGETVRLSDFGTFEARLGRDPINDVKVVEFTPAEAFSEEINRLV
jgi:nucleoid DNA-binding protein